MKSNEDLTQNMATDPNTSNNEVSGRRMHFVVIVLGDVGRSPRMQYHAASLLDEGHVVSLVGYEGVELIPSLSSKPERLNVVRFSVPSPEILRKFLPVYLVWRIISLCFYLFYALLVLVPMGSGAPVDCLLVQNPPAMPLLVVVYLYCSFCHFVRGKRPAMVIDWHNLGFSMLSQPTFSKIARMYEQIMAPTATAHLCVTNAMKAFLHTHFHVPESRISVLYDCPPAMFKPTSCEEQHELLTRLHTEICAACPSSWHTAFDPTRQTILTELDASDGKYVPRRGRPALITSSTSWSSDEDFGILLEAAISLDRQITESDSSLRVLIVVTGKGPQKEYYLERISRLQLKHVAIQTLWLEPVDYPKLLACADLGISLHTSTSGIDLPMKVLDLFGCRVPVCALDFQCLSELVLDDENGRTFETSGQLEKHLYSLLRTLEDHTTRFEPHSFGDLSRYSRALEGRKRWGDNWKENAYPTLLQSTVQVTASST